MNPRPLKTDTTPSKLAELGAPYLATWRRAFKSTGLHRVAALAREAEAETAYAPLQKLLADLQAKLAVAATNDPNRAVIEASIKTNYSRASSAHSEAMAAAGRTFTSPESVRLIHGDLKRMVAAIETSLAEILATQNQFNAKMGYGACSAEEIELSNSAAAALAEFRRRHVEPLYSDFNAAVEDGASPIALRTPWQASWVLAGCDWHDLKP